MKKKQFAPLVICDVEGAGIIQSRHSHTYYEIIYVQKGTGTHILNQNRLPYKAGDLFLICPEDEHCFDYKKYTCVTLIKFTDEFFSSQNQSIPHVGIVFSPQDLMRHKLLKEIKLTFDEPFKTILRSTIDNIKAYNGSTDIATCPYIFYQILSLFGLITQALGRIDAQLVNCPPGKQELISYIHQHIYEPENIQVKKVAAHFNIAPSYFSAWFKRNFDISYRDYINGYRVKLIEIRLGNKASTLSQIAEEFGFTDVSHLSNYFKKQTNTNASHYGRTA